MVSVLQRETRALGTPQGGPPNSPRGRWSEQTAFEKRRHWCPGGKCCIDKVPKGNLLLPRIKNKS